MADTGPAYRHERVAFFNTGTTASPVYVLMGEGFETLDDSRNPEVDETAYVNSVNKVKTIGSYGPEWAFDGTVIKESTVIAFLRAIGDNLSIGNDAASDIVVFDMWSTTAGGDLNTTTGIAAAKRYPVSVQMDSTGGGPGAEKLKFSGVLLGTGDPTDGTFDTADNTFTESIS